MPIVSWLLKMTSLENDSISRWGRPDKVSELQHSFAKNEMYVQSPPSRSDFFWNEQALLFEKLIKLSLTWKDAIFQKFCYFSLKKNIFASAIHSNFVSLFTSGPLLQLLSFLRLNCQKHWFQMKISPLVIRNHLWILQRSKHLHFLELFHKTHLVLGDPVSM